MPSLAHKTPMILFAGLAAMFALLALPAQSPAYKTLGTKWPGGTVTYYNGLKEYDPAVKTAVTAWNKSGAKVRLIRVSKKRARVKIRYLPDSTCRGLARLPRTKRTTQATIYLPRPTAPAACRDEFTMTIIAAHEFGHVLGLNHEQSRCASMNPVGNRTGGSLCAEVGGTPPWLWRCRILEPDDVRGAIRIYGGKYKASKFKTSPLCALYPDPPPVTILNVAAGPGPGETTVTATRPADAVVPAFLLDEFSGGVAPVLYVGYQSGTCATVGPGVPKVGVDWANAAAGARISGLTAGPNCVSVWAADAIGRPSAPAMQDVTIS